MSLAGKIEECPPLQKFNNSPPNDTRKKLKCCVCKLVPSHSRNYYGCIFCSSCFRKYIWKPARIPSKTDFNEGRSLAEAKETTST